MKMSRYNLKNTIIKKKGKIEKDVTKKTSGPCGGEDNDNLVESRRS